MLAMVPICKLLDKMVKKYNVKKKLVLFIVKKLCGFFNYNVLVKSMILLYMYFFLSSLLTTIDLEFDNGYEVASFSIGFIAFCFLIFFMFGIFTIIQRYHKRIEEDEGIRKRLSSIIEDINVERKRTCARFYIPIYLLRRAVFMTLIVTFDNYYLLVAH